MADVSVNLVVNRSLLDPNFDGYKLSLESSPTYRIQLAQGVDEVKLTDEQYSYQHVKAFGIHNHLFSDPYNENTVYYIDSSWSVYSCTVFTETAIESPVKVFEIPDAANYQFIPGRHNATISFPNAEWAVLSDGAGRLFILSTDDRKSTNKWKAVFSHTALGEGKGFALVASTVGTDNETQRLECLVLHVDPVEQAQSLETHTQNDGQSPFITVLEWLTYSTEVSRISWALERTRRLVGSRSPDYASIECGGDAVIISADRPFKMVYDSLKPVKNEQSTSEDTNEKSTPAYTWSQKADDVTVVLPVPSTTTRPDVVFQLKPQQIELSIKNGKELLCGQLHRQVDVDSSTWTIENDRIEVTLVKKEECTWDEVVCGDERGEMVLDPEVVQRVHERLAHLTTENPLADPEEDKKPPYNAQQLEECDLYPDESSTMLRIDGETHSITHQVHLGSNQWLFNAQLGADQAPCICLRHDVDGLLWQPVSSADVQGSGNPWSHVATFHALGYVQASKTSKKFSGCPRDCSYAYVADCVRHIYVYRQPSPTDTPLRNRKTGRQVTAVSKQQVISLDTSGDTLGVVATPERIFILAGRTLYVVRVI